MTTQISDERAAPDRRRRSRRRALWLPVAAGVLALLGLGLLLMQTQPRGLIRAIPLPTWLNSALQGQQGEHLFYVTHVALGAAFNQVGAPAGAAASEWFKAAWHARTNAEIEYAAQGLAQAVRRGQAAQLEANLCPYVSNWTESAEPGSWGARGRQLAALRLANLTCVDESMFFGLVPDDMPLEYAAHPPVSGLYHETWYPSDGVAPEPVAPATWLHNLAHGEIVLLYNCPTGCSDVLAQAADLQQRLPPGRNAHGGPARVLIVAYDTMDTPLAVVAWGHVLRLDHIDADAIETFYADHVDRGVECRYLVC